MSQKRWFSLLTAFLMLCCAVAPTGVLAEDAVVVPAQVTEAPVVEATDAPVEALTDAPTAEPTEAQVVTDAPTAEPTAAPTEAPVVTEAPAAEPTEVPATEAPTEEPTEAPDVFVPGYARVSGGTKLYDSPAVQGEAAKLDGSAVVYAAKRADDKTAVQVAVFDGASVIEKWVKAERVAMLSAAEIEQHEATCGDDCADYAGCKLPATTVVAPQPAVTEAPVTEEPVVTDAPATEAPVVPDAPAETPGLADGIADAATKPPVIAPQLPSGEEVVDVASRSPLRVKALHAMSETANVGDTLAFTTEFEGSGDIAWIEYHIYDIYGQHLTGYHGEGAGISEVYFYDTSVTGAGKYCARVYLLAMDGTLSQVDSIWVTVGKQEPLRVAALNAASTTATVGDWLVFTTQYEGTGNILWIEYHIYDIYGQHLTGYRGEGAGISDVYYYDTSVTGPGKYCARVFLMATDGTFTYVDSEWVEVTAPVPSLQVTALTPDRPSYTVGSEEAISFAPTYEGDGELGRMEFYVYDNAWNVLTSAYYTLADLESAFGTDDFRSVKFQFRADDYPACTSFFARVYFIAADGTFSMAESEWVEVVRSSLQVTALTPVRPSYTVGSEEAISFAPTYEGDGEMGRMEFYVYDNAWNVLTSAYYTLADMESAFGTDDFRSVKFQFRADDYPACTSFFARVYFIAADGTFSMAESEWVEVVRSSLQVTALTPDVTSYTLGSPEALCFTPTFEGIGTLARMEYYVYDQAWNVLTSAQYTPEDIEGIYGSSDLHQVTIRFRPDDYPDCTTCFARLYLIAADGTYSMAESEWVEILCFTYEEAADGAGMVITGYLGRKTDVVIPDTIGGKQVVAIGDWAFRDNSTLTAVHIPQEVTTIGSGAFYGCQSLMSIEIPGGVTAIQEQTFENCTALTNAVLPDGVTVLGRAAFKNCPSLTSMTSR